MIPAFRMIVAGAFVVALFHAASSASADPLPGQALKFQQLPLNNGLAPSAGGAPFPGHDEMSTAYATRDPLGQITGWSGPYMADDFADTFTTPVVHLRWWGSYLTPPSLGSVTQFLISFEEDVPATTDSPSHPGAPILTQIVHPGVLAPGSGTFTEKLINAEVAEPLYEYNAELHLGKEFHQEPDSIYWLKIVALVDPQQGMVAWGWHNRDWSIANPLASPTVVPGEHIAGFVGPTSSPVHHFQDNAVTGGVIVTVNPDMPNMPSIQQIGFTPQFYSTPVDGPIGISAFSKDLAFELYTTPEPSTWALLSLGAVGALVLRRRRPRD
jgi:hypothetical protein